jgi:hypothetical protein
MRLDIGGWGYMNVWPRTLVGLQLLVDVGGATLAFGGRGWGYS